MIYVIVAAVIFIIVVAIVDHFSQHEEEGKNRWTK